MAEIGIKGDRSMELDYEDLADTPARPDTPTEEDREPEDRSDTHAPPDDADHGFGHESGGLGG
jgi:hypothetical protein